MYLKALEIQGFKSFPDKTRISFDKGITAVVGPNGSGKSNISDALRWVLGETSAKQLRGGGRMENVIFGGTQGRNPMGYTAVSLVLENSDRRLEVDADEVVISRKYYRSGESEYGINGQSVRLRDIYELLLDTGLGRDGYSIIGQGRIAEIVGSKSGERREIFEEASGIARFRYRRVEAQKRLAATEDNLVRLRDILGMLEARVGPLEKDSAKAKRYLELAAERKAYEVTLWVDTLRASRDELRGQQRKIEIAGADYAEKGRQIEAIDAATEGIRGEIEGLILETERHNADIRTLQEEIAGRDSRVAVLKNDIRHNEERIEALEEEIRNSGEAHGEILAQIEAHKADIEVVTQNLKTVNDATEALENELMEIQRKSMEGSELRDRLQAELAGLTDRATELKVEEAAASGTLSTGAKQLEEREAELANQRVLQKKLTDDEADTAEFLEEAQNNQTKLANILAGLEMKLEGRRAALETAKETENRVTNQGIAAKDRVNTLQELERSLDGFQGSVKNVINASRHGKLRGVIGPVSTILSVEKGYEVAIETALGYSLQNVVVEDEGAAKAAMTYLKETGGGRATFLPLDTVKPRRLATNLPEGAKSAQKLVQYETRYENIVSSLLAHIVVVEDLGEASRTAKALDYRNRVVTRDGQVINAGGSFTGGSVSRSTGLFSRKQEIEELEQKLQKLREQKREAAEETAKLTAEVEALAAEQTATNSEAIIAGQDRVRAEGELAGLQNSLAGVTRRIAEIGGECETQRRRHEEATAQLKAAREEGEATAARIEHLSGRLAEISGADDAFLAKREQLSEALSAKRLEALGLERDIEQHRQGIQALEGRTGEGAAHRQALRANITLLQGQCAEYLEKIGAVEREAEDSKTRIGEIEAQINQKAEARIQKEGSIVEQTKRERALTAEREELGREMARLEEQKTALEGRYETTIGQLWEEYELTPQQAEPLCVDFDSVGELRRKVTELRGSIRALGDVNVGAIEEYAEVRKEYDFLTAQVGDVEKSKAELEKMIEEISAEMTTLFSESFAEINRNFGRIFAELFGGGTGALILSDPADLLESGIEIEVSPPGKIIKDLGQLSGGEQSLVAICIYFAILAVNPAPFCVLDEIDAALDDVNVGRFAQYLRRITKKTQFIVITHRRGTMEEADIMYGVTMQESGVSKMLRLNIADVDVSLVR